MASHLKNLVNILCQPNTNKFRDPKIQADVFARNKRLLLGQLGTCIFQPTVSYFENMPSSVYLLLTSINMINLVLFLILCRSYQHIFHIHMTAVMAFSPVILVTLNNDFAFPQFNLGIVTPFFLLLITKNYWLMALTGTSQALISLTLLRRVFKRAFLTGNPEDLVDRLIDTNTGLTIFVTCILGFIMRTLEKKTEELTRANERAQEALEQQKTFVFSFSHELRNPLNSLLGNLQLALMSLPPSSDAMSMVKTARICAEVLLQLVNNILDVGKHDIGRLEVNPAPVKVHAAFERLWSITSELMARKNLASHLVIEKRVPAMLMIDQHRLDQVMMNLLGNAIKFTEQGSITVSVEWLESTSFGERNFEPKPFDESREGVFEKEQNLFHLGLSSPRKMQESDRHVFLHGRKREFNLEAVSGSDQEVQGILRIAVRDTGIGMDPAAIQKLFKKFSQVSVDTNKRQIGTGLGLFIAKQICQCMGGDVRAYSRPGKGTTFIVCIPTRTVVNVTRSHITLTTLELTSKLSTLKLQAIVADDSVFNINLLTGYFGKISAQVVAKAMNGCEALESYIKAVKAGITVDIVTLDIDMPKMDGKTTCVKIREFERRRNIQPTLIVLISGNYDEQQVGDCLNSNNDRNADYFLRKPLSFEDFVSAVHMLRSRTHR